MKMKANHMIMTIALMMLMLIYGYNSSCSAQSASNVDYDKAFLVDVRTPAEFSEGSAKGAVNIPLNEVQKRIQEFQGKEHIVVFCRSGARSAQAKRILEQNGITNVSNGGTWLDVDRAMQLKKAKK